MPENPNAPKENLSTLTGKTAVLSVEELTSTLKQVQADFENYRKRTQQELNANYLRGKAAALKEMLDFSDTLDSAIAKVQDSHKKDLENLRIQFLKILAQNGVKPIQTIGKMFDPFTSECMIQGKDPTTRDEIVLEEIQKGYFFHQDVLRTAKVKVNKHEEPKENETKDTNQKTSKPNGGDMK